MGCHLGRRTLEILAHNAPGAAELLGSVSTRVPLRALCAKVRRRLRPARQEPPALDALLSGCGRECPVSR